MLRRLVAGTSALVVATIGLGAQPAEAGPHRDRMITRVMRHMTLKQKVEQLFVLQVYGTSADTTDPTAVAKNQKLYGVDNAAQLIAKYHPGGIIYYAADPPNLRSPRQIAHLSNGIQWAAMHQWPPIPELIATDQEQGSVVTRVPPPFTRFPGSQALAAGRRPRDAYVSARITGRELRAIGINQDYAPDSDVNVDPANPVIGVRSYGSNPTLVARFAAAAVDGYQSAGVIATAKHFPGHGDTHQDSHTGVPVIHHTKEQWEKFDLPPFKADIEHGIDAIMTAHIVVPALDPSGDPATLSRPIITGILRNRLHYDGVVVTDSLGMQGVRDKYGDKRVPVLALKAGVDQLLKPPAGVFTTQLDAVLKAVRDGELKRSRIDQAVYRILRLKKKHRLFRHPYVNERRVDHVVGTKRQRRVEQRITDRTTTLVKNDDGLLPLSAEDAKSVFVTGWGTQTTRTLAADIERRGATTTVRATGVSPSQAQIDRAVAAAKSHDVTVVTTDRAWDVSTKPGHNGPAQANLVKALVATGKPVVVAAVRDAYDIGYFPKAPTYLVTYSYTPAALESLTKVIFGEREPTGKLPVMIPVAGHPDKTLFPYGYGLGYRK